MIQETKSNFEAIEHSDDAPEKFEYFSEDISWLWRLEEIIKEIKESKR